MEQNGRILVTEYGGKLLVCHMVGNRPDRVFLEDPSSAELPVGTIVIGRIKKIIPGIKAAFVSLGAKQEYFMTLPAEHDNSVLLVNRSYDGTLKCDDELVVQIKKQAVKTKQPAVDCHISLAGRYAVIQTGHSGFHVSAKLSKNQKLGFQALKDEMHCEDELIIRTNAADASMDAVRSDIQTLVSQQEHIKEIYRYRTCYSVLYRALPVYLTVIRDIPNGAYDEIVTDRPELKNAIESALSGYQNVPEEDGSHESMPSVRLYEDASYPLLKLYSVETAIKGLLERKVWLKRGGFLIVDQTETLTAIDVNTGKNDNKKGDLAFSVNMEAVSEIGRQLRARNISGMILIDFINMKDSTQTDALAEALKAILKKDYVKANFIDITGLGLFEVTREKRFSSLREQLL